MADFEKNHPGIAEQELWKLFLRKAEEQGLDRDFISAVGEVCAIGLNLSKYIVRFFPTFTLHDETHSANVCRWMWVLLREEGRKKLTPHEAALLLMAACCHDIGMAVSPEQEEQMRLRTYPGWDDYFRQNLKDDEEYEEKKVISDRMLRNFVRMHHHERIGENLRESDWPDGVFEEELDRELLLELCRSHGTELEGAELTCRGELYDLRLCAVLLRLADLLDFDAGRTPEVLFRQMGLDRPKDAESWRSAQEHLKNRTGKFREKFVNGCIPYVAAYDNPSVEQENRKYLDWVDTELTNCRNCLSQSSRWKNLDLPYKVDDRKVKRKGYAAGKFCMTMDQDKVIDLLTGENLYSDAGVFVRELLQNSIDAVLMRAKQDPNFSLKDGLIQIDTWMDEEANTWFRIRDNGTGMNEHIIQNHFLKVGNSYYTSEEFKYANRHAPKGSYTAISRFGIGILSCFMGDKEHTQLKVSTKRFDEKGKSGIRLDVTGLHGYYFLCKEKKHPESELWFPKMPSLNEEDRGYRTEPGTTICVNTNLLRMGELRSFQEILDKYVQFPEIRVTYNGPEGYKEYPTQQELLEAVHGLNLGGAVKQYVHEIPDGWFAELKKEFPYFRWEEKPFITFRYIPIDWLSDSENMTGASIMFDVHFPIFDAILRPEDADENGSRRIRSNFNYALTDTGEIAIDYWVNRCYQGRQVPYEETDILGEKKHFVFSLVGLNAMVSPLEKQTLEMILRIPLNKESYHVAFSYNGILAGEFDGMEYEGYGENTNLTTFLLCGSFQPEVNLARNAMTFLNPEASCCLAMVAHPLGLDREISILDGPELQMMTERDLWRVLDRHPLWINKLDDMKNTRIRWQNEHIGRLWIAAHKRKNVVYYEFNPSEFGVQHCRCSNDPSDGLTADFPAAMFLSPERDNSPLSSCGLGTPIYNRKHPFSCWLIQNHSQLTSKVPAMYDKMIRILMLSMDIGEICRTVNTILKSLSVLEGNCFDVCDELYLQECDFVQKFDLL